MDLLLAMCRRRLMPGRPCTYYQERYWVAPLVDEKYRQSGIAARPRPIDTIAKPLRSLEMRLICYGSAGFNPIVRSLSFNRPYCWP
jgi:hypothetical protein